MNSGKKKQKKWKPPSHFYYNQESKADLGGNQDSLQALLVLEGSKHMTMSLEMTFLHSLNRS